MKALLTALVVTVAIAPVSAQQRGYPTRGNVTRMDMRIPFSKPSDFAPKEDNSKTDVSGHVCYGVGPASMCIGTDGTVSANVDAGAHFSIYANPKDGNMGGCVGAGAGLYLGPVGVSGSAAACGDKHKGLTVETSTSCGVGPVGVGATTTTYDKNR